MSVVQGFLTGMILWAALVYTIPWATGYMVTNDQLRLALTQQNACIESYADMVSTWHDSNAEMCEYMVSNRLMCEVRVP